MAISGPSHVPAASRFPVPRLLVLSLFFFSGLSGLVYEVVWGRMFSLVLGTTVYSISTVLSVFMGGMALGSWLCGRLVDRPGANGLRIYGYLEIGVGIFALLLPVLMDLSDGIFRSAWPLLSNSFVGQMALRILLAAMVLIVPATLMGGSLPVLSRYLVRRLNQSGPVIGTLYAINTLGAVLGCLLAGFFFLEHLGVRNTLLIAAVMNFIVGGAAIFASGRSALPPVHVDEPPEAGTVRPIAYTPRQIRLALILFGVSGFAALALEVCWTRSLLYFVSVDTWAFSAMLAAFLTGIGVGSLILAPLTNKIRNPLAALGAIQLMVGVTAALSIPLMAGLYGLSDTIPTASAEGATLLGHLRFKLLNSFFIMLLPTLLMGAAFPLVSSIYVAGRKQVGQGVGTLYALNTMGAIAGSLLAGFLLMPLLGLQRSILLVASLYMAGGLLLFVAAFPQGLRRPRAELTFAAGVLALVVLNLTFAGQPVILLTRYFQEQTGQFRLLYLREGPAASLAVLEKSNGIRRVNINGIDTAFDNYMDMQVHRMLSHLPLLLHPDPQKVLIVGFGMGSTVWGCCQHPVQRVDVVELLRDEIETAAYFEKINHGVVRHPRFRFIEGDGRNYLLGTREMYDMISFNAIHPRFSAALYTKDFYEVCRKRMTPDGVICAWMTQNSMTDEEWRMLCRSFIEVFPHSTLWYCNPQHFCLIGTLKPIQIDLADWQKRMAQEEIRADLADSYLEDYMILASRYMLGRATLQEYVADAPLNTDDHPLIEFAREMTDQERPIILQLVEMKESLIPIMTAGPDSETLRQQLAIYEESSRHMMDGQIEFWYPTNPLKAEIAYRRALLAVPGNQDVLHLLGFSTVREQKARAALSARPSHPPSLAILGRILLNQGHLSAAEKLLVRAVQLDRTYVPALRNLGFLYLIQGDTEKAAGPLSAVARATGRSKPQDPRVLYALGMALSQQEMQEQALNLKQTAIQQNRLTVEWYDLFQATITQMVELQDEDS
ncbi:MAG: fused MFS/spermidine synthase [Candidatus Eisenbacteria sp.]|nr:fused MFS/spermidine synthase [Candidatus Eisenbacteria bacterium]